MPLILIFAIKEEVFPTTPTHMKMTESIDCLKGKRTSPVNKTVARAIESDIADMSY